MDSSPPKKHGAEWWALLFTIAVALASGAVSIGALKERIETLTAQYIQQQETIEQMRRDKTRDDKMDEALQRLVRVETRLDTVGSDVKELKEKKH